MQNKAAGALAVALTAISMAGMAQGAARAADVKVVVRHVRSASGQVGCALFASERGFPRDTSRAMARMLRPIAGGSANCVFRDLPPGVYAVVVFHDENGNGVLDTNLLGAPAEGYGVSNNHTYALSPPKWVESQFTVGASEAKTLAIDLRY